MNHKKYLTKIWAGRLISLLIALPFIFSGAMKVMHPPEVVEGMAKLGLPQTLLVTLAVLELGSTLLYLIPRTAVLGAILLTGYMGGAICTHLRVGEGVLPHIVFGLLIWGGIYLRDGRLRELIPLRKI